jgi:hypothetical protein
MAKPAVRLLVKARPTRPAMTVRLAAGRSLALKMRPLFGSIERPTAMGAAARPAWFIAESEQGQLNPWDLCHGIMSKGFGVAGATDIAFAEPDLDQQWIWSEPARQMLGAADRCDKAEEQDSDVYATDTPNNWFRDDEHAQLDRAQRAVGTPDADGMIRIAHVDTGYDPDHSMTPALLRRDLQRNFVEGEDPRDASDQTKDSLFTNRGHGTGTLGLLAGGIFSGVDQPLGAASHLEIVPIRVASSVVLFRNSAIAQAFDYVHSLSNSARNRVDIVTMSMGGIASQAWADAVNALYERGIFVVTAAGNNFGNLPTRFIVYPARFNRVVAACGIMADGRPWADLPIRKMAGCYGPRAKEPTAIAAYTPNVPWAKLGCRELLDWDGNGTSSATPQVAAAAALWMQKNRKALDRYTQPWMRVEATRKALFESAGKIADKERMRRFGQGILHANDALRVAPAAARELAKQESDSAAFSLLRTVTGLGLKAPMSASDRMLELEALQISQRSREVEELLMERDEGKPISDRTILEAIADQPRASRALKAKINTVLGRPTPPAAPGAPQPPTTAPARPPARAPIETGLAAEAGQLHKPPCRPLRIFAFDPSAGTNLETFHLNETTTEVAWEAQLLPGPVGDYLEVVDIDPPNNAAYLPVDLNRPELLAQCGLQPSVGNPQFHQQMVYAVAMKTIQHFERALGRVALWAERMGTIDGKFQHRFVRRLRIYPHALREANAFYSPEKRALLFGYFSANAADVGDNLPGGIVFTCLSHDIVAHETTHALLDGLHPRFKEPTNLDMLAFHEAFADIVALFQHFSLADALKDQIAKSRGKLEVAELLGSLAKEFGQAIGHRKALRVAIGTPPKRTDYDSSTEAHARGAVLVSAVFDAFLKIYANDTAGLFRLASGGTGVLPPGQIPHELVEQLAQSAAKIASRVLGICIRALDYCPPVDLTFGEYLRALITADYDLVPHGGQLYRVAFVQAFRARGIYPPGVNNLAIDALVWEKPESALDGLAELFAARQSKWSLSSDRHQAYVTSNDEARAIHNWISAKAAPQTLRMLGLYKTDRRRAATIDNVRGEISKLEVHSVRPLRRIGPDGQILDNVVIEITQSFRPRDDGGLYRGGCTIICDRESGEVRYVIRKRVGHRGRREEELAFRETKAMRAGYGLYFDERAFGEPFAIAHRHS